MVTPQVTRRWRALAAAFGDRATLGKPLGPLTTYGVGGPAALFVEIEGPDDLDEVRRTWRQHAPEFEAPPAVFVLGRGSNLLVADEGFEGIVVHLGAGFGAVDLPPDRGCAARRGRSGRGAGGRGGGPAGAGPAAWPTRDGADCHGRSACLARSAARCA